MRILLIYFTGTYNTRYITDIIKSRFVKKYQADVDTLEINSLTYHTTPNIGNYDIVGFGYPIYAFNTPKYFLKYLQKQILKEYVNKETIFFIYKNSGEVYHINDASSYSLVKMLEKKGIEIKNEYHFGMPYNIHFRFEDGIVKEMLLMNEKLADILVFEIVHKILNIKKYRVREKIISSVFKIQYIGGNINSFFYHVNKKQCDHCLMCVKTCPVNNIYVKKGKIKFHHHCIMCMRCSLNCHKNAFTIGFLNSWKVNGKYDFEKIRDHDFLKKYLKDDTKGFFKCYIPYNKVINKRYLELFGEDTIDD